jgi:hypothetical protein
MRYLIGLVAVCLGLQILGNAQSTGTESELADDKLAGALWHIAVATHTPIGFESVEFVRLPGALKDVDAFPISSRDEALHAVVDADSRYTWRALGSFVVVRPKHAWNDAAEAFNRRVQNLRLTNTTSSAVMFGLHNVIYTSAFTMNSRVRAKAGPVSLEVRSGSVIDVLNQLLEATDTVLWIGTYRPNAQLNQRFPTWHVQMQLRTTTGMHSLTESPPTLATMQ